MHPGKSVLGRILLTGLGSAHGDDQAGWLFTEEISRAVATAEALQPLIEIRRALIPLDLLDWFGSVDILHVCDACQRPDHPSAATADHGVHRLQWMHGRLWIAEGNAAGHAVDCPGQLRLRTGSTHDYGLPDVLCLAAATGQLPSHVIIWTVEGSRFQPGDELTERTGEGVREVVRRLMGELLKELPGPETSGSQG